MAFIRTLSSGKFRADIRMKGILKNKTFPTLLLAQAWADKIEQTIKTVPNLAQAELLALTDADIDSMGGEELFKQLGVDLFVIRNQARFEAINALSKKELLQLSPQDIERMGGAELFLQAGKRIRYKTFREVCNEYLARWGKKDYQGQMQRVDYWCKMNLIMNINDLKTIAQLEQFLTGTQPIAFMVASGQVDIYLDIQRTLVKFRYPSLDKRSKGVVMRFLIKITGYSRQQITRLIKQYSDTGKIERQQRPYQGFERIYTAEDIRLLASLDERHETLSGPATKKLCERAFTIFKQAPYQRLAGISVAHLYNLRKSKCYLRQRFTFEKTRPKVALIGERKKPRTNGEPGFIRIDTVHQGDQDKQKGVYHINAVDEVTQFEVICTVERISELYLLPAIEQLLD
ncbi:MAG: hypothetical protein QX191_07745, partial [Methylococcaceae bacterium]